MALLKNTLRMLVLAAMAAAGTSSMADQPYHPFAEPMSFDPDWQFFAPVDIQSLEDAAAREKANYGWYATYERMHVGLDRPLIEPENNKFDRTWGNKFTFGVMGDDDSGWDFQFLHVSGPNTYTGTRNIRANILAVDDDNVFTFPIFRERYPFDPNFGDGTYFVRDSLNVASLGSFEVNKKWRLAPYQHGGFLEPLVGLRYMDFTDINVADGFTTFTSAAGNPVELFSTSDIRNQNRMFLGQLGFRYFRDVGRMRLSGEAKALFGGNFQTGSVQTQEYQFEYTASGTATPPIDVDIVSEPINILSDAPGLNDKFVFGLDARLDASYILTRNIAFRSGVSLLMIGDGIARGSQIRGISDGFNQPLIFGPSASFVQQNLIMPGISFGLTLNR